METLISLYRNLYGKVPAHTEAITGSGSNRAYYRFSNNEGESVIACRGTSVHENHAFITLSRHFASKGLPVPAIFATDPTEECYIQEDVGQCSLFEALHSGRTSGGIYSSEELTLVKRAMQLLPHVQVEGARGLDFSVCHPVPAFDRTGILFDLNYFKYCFLKTTSVEFDEYRLEQDFQDFATDLLSQGEAITQQPTFMYRDFQARNIILDNANRLHLIDYQGGRRGPLQYDVVSFLWQASSRFPDSVREECIDIYADELSLLIGLGKAEVVKKIHETLPLFVLFRLLQVLGAYGFRGRYERKQHFLDSIPPALDNLQHIIPSCPYPYLHDTCLQFFIQERHT